MPTRWTQSDIDALEAEFGQPGEVEDPGVEESQAVWERYKRWEGPPLHATQKEAWNNREAIYMLLDGERGTGKCRESSSYAYLKDHLARLASLNPGVLFGEAAINETVWSFDRTGCVPAGASGFYRESGRQAIRWDLAHGGEITGSPIHPIWCCAWRPGSPAMFGYIRLRHFRDLSADGWRVWTPLIAHPGITRSKLQVVCGIEITQDVGYLLGALCGDGGCSQKAIIFTNSDQECIARVERACRSIGSYLSKHKEKWSYGIGVANVRKIVRAGKLNCTSYYKRIPDFIVASPLPVITAFLRGLFDTDGTVGRNGEISFCTTSKQLGIDVQDILVALGILCVRRPRKSASGRPTWTLHVMGTNATKFGEMIGFEITRKRRRIKTRTPIENRNRYGYPDAIKDLLREVQTRQRTHGKIHGVPVPVTFKQVTRRKGRWGEPRTAWQLNRHFPWGQEYHLFDSKAEADEISERINKRLGELYRSVRNREWHRGNASLRQAYKYVPSPQKLAKFIKLYGHADDFRNFLISDTWVEVKSSEETTCADLVDLYVPGTNSFVCSGTINHNTVLGLHMLVEHCLSERDALAVILVEVTTMAEEGGAWHKLVHEVLPIWRDGWTDKNGKHHPGIGIQFTEPRLHATSRKPYIWIQNRYGTNSRAILISLPIEGNVKDRVKGIEPSFCLVDEAQTLASREYFAAVVQQIGRRPRIKGRQLLLYCCNPAGPSHWLYRIFFVDPIDKDSGEWNPQYARYHIPIGENLDYLPPGYYDRVIEACRGDPVEEARMIRGEWIDRPTGEAVFKDLYSEQVHVRGDASHNVGILPAPGFVVYVGYDLGPANSSIHFLQCVQIQTGSIWIVFDELVMVSSYIPYDKIVPKVIGRMDYWAKVCHHQFTFDHIADSSAFLWMRETGSFDVKIFQEESARLGRPFTLRPAPKGPGSVAERVRMMMELLAKKELIVSATCIRTREMFRMLESRRAGREYDAQAGLTPKKSPHVHVFDSLTYPIITVRLGATATYNFGQPHRSGITYLA